MLEKAVGCAILDVSFRKLLNINGKIILRRLFVVFKQDFPLVLEYLAIAPI
jgi:hypothetical protein